MHIDVFFWTQGSVAIRVFVFCLFFVSHEVV
jgi:hypothetical protein